MRSAKQQKRRTKAPAPLPACRRLASPLKAALGIAAHMGWASVVTIVPDGALFRVLRTDHIETANPEDIEAQGPYHRAAGFLGPKRIPVPANPPAVVERGLAHQRRHTLASLRTLAAELALSGYELAAGGILTGRGSLADSLEAVLASHAQIHLAEGLAVRAAVDYALEHLGIPTTRIDKQSLLAHAADALGFGEAELVARLRAARPESGGRWRQEERLAALAATLALRGRS